MLPCTAAVTMVTDTSLLFFLLSSLSFPPVRWLSLSTLSFLFRLCFLPFVLPCSCFSHFLRRTILGLIYNALKIFSEMNNKLFEECNAKFKEDTEMCVCVCLSVLDLSDSNSIGSGRRNW